jgi:hypothetical protein
MLLVLAACSSGVRSHDAPAARLAPGGVTLMLDSSWWLQVQRDGNHALGYGALPVRVTVARDAFDGPVLLDTVARWARPFDRDRSPDPDCAYTVTFHDTAPQGLVHSLPVHLCDMLAGAFRQAWAARSVAEVSDVVETAWRNAPFQRR